MPLLLRGSYSSTKCTAIVFCLFTVLGLIYVYRKGVTRAVTDLGGGGGEVGGAEVRSSRGVCVGYVAAMNSCRYCPFWGYMY